MSTCSLLPKLEREALEALRAWHRLDVAGPPHRERFAGGRWQRSGCRCDGCKRWAQDRREARARLDEAVLTLDLYS